MSQLRWSPKARWRYAVGLPCVLVANFRCDTPARGGAFADERRVVAAMKAAACGRETLIQPSGGTAPHDPPHGLAVGPYIIDERACPWSCRSHRMFASWRSNG